jgi:hypothetical protein
MHKIAWFTVLPGSQNTQTRLPHTSPWLTMFAYCVFNQTDAGWRAGPAR